MIITSYLDRVVEKITYRSFGIIKTNHKYFVFKLDSLKLCLKFMGIKIYLEPLRNLEMNEMKLEKVIKKIK